MTTFKEIQGLNIRSYTDDPTDPLEGQMWYNQSRVNLRGVVASGAWSSTAHNTYATNGSAGAGTQTAGLTFGGSTPGTAPTDTSEYNGTGWLVSGDLNTGRRNLSGAGTQTAGLGFGGYKTPPAAVSNDTEEYNGTGWTSSNNLNTARWTLGGFGIQDAAVAFGGHNNVPGSTQTNATEEYNGSTWTSGNNYLDSRATGQSGTGILTAGFGANAGGPGSLSANTAHYDGTNWTASVDLPATRRSMTAAGTTTDTIVAGGRSPGIVGTCLRFDGTSWASIPSLGTARAAATMSSQMPATAAWFSQGEPPPGTNTNAVEEWNFTSNTVTQGTWATGGSLTTGRQDVGGCGTKAAGLAIGGRTGSSGPFTQSGVCEEYNGAIWSEQNDLNTARGEASGCGTQTAAVCFGGAPDSNATETYNGASWTTSPATLNTGRSSGASFGASSSSAVFCGGYGGTRVANVEEFNGSAWTNATALPEARYNAGGAGIESAGIVLGGSNAPAGTVVFDTSVEYNGSSWTTGGTNPASLEGQGMNGTQAACISYGGPTTLTSNSFTYDGTNWSTNSNMATNRAGLGASKGASITNTLGFGGSTPPNRQMTNTEEFTAETTSVNIVSITTS